MRARHRWLRLRAPAAADRRDSHRRSVALFELITELAPQRDRLAATMRPPVRPARSDSTRTRVAPARQLVVHRQTCRRSATRGHTNSRLPDWHPAMPPVRPRRCHSGSLLRSSPASVGVKCQCRQRVRIDGRLRQGGQRAPVQFDAIEVGDLRHSGPTGEFVTKPDQFPFGGQHAGVKAFVQRSPGLGAHLLQQGDIGSRAAHRNRMHRFARLWPTAAPSRPCTASEMLRGKPFRVSAFGPAGQHLGDEERVTAGDLM